MTSQRTRILSVFTGETPDAVPFMLDLSHWFYHRHGLPWDLSQAYDEPERALIEEHKRLGAGFYVPNLGSFFTIEHAPDVVCDVLKQTSSAGTEITWRYETPLGTIQRRRRWHESTYSWHVSEWGVSTERDLRVLAHALGGRTYTPRWDRYHAWNDCVGEIGVVYIPAGYSAVGQLLHYWMGVEAVVYAASDWPHTLRETVDRINDNNLLLIDLLAQSPAEVVIMGDNFSSDVQPPAFFQRWSAPYYTEAIRRLHRAGKKVAVHVDGRLKGTLRMMRHVGADCVDAVTPAPMGDLTPDECRDEAGADMILSGGVPPTLWLESIDPEDFKRSVIRWLDLRRRSPRLIAGAGDQVPPGAPEERIHLMRDLVEEHGRH